MAEFAAQELRAPLDAASVPYAEIIDRVRCAPRRRALVRAMITVESGYKERARSRKGAMGLMQLMPERPGASM